jgi:hypothetical protein
MMGVPREPIGTFGNFVTTRLATGGAFRRPAELQYLVEAGVTHVINCRVSSSDVALLAHRLIYLHDPTFDNGGPKPVAWFRPAIEFALVALAAPGNVVYVHCRKGVNRGPSMCYAIMRALGWSRADALRAIHNGRPITRGGIRYARDADRAVRVLGYL